mmetsp:Transcript_9528/g.23272  ORF Transcript_9528/g.23272 Transcript_9528/m.23272 type:complete len:249 (+) Transcript_9528:1076-1822(+)
MALLLSLAGFFLLEAEDAEEDLFNPVVEVPAFFFFFLEASALGLSFVLAAPMPDAVAAPEEEPTLIPDEEDCADSADIPGATAGALDVAAGASGCTIAVPERTMPAATPMGCCPTAIPATDWTLACCCWCCAANALVLAFVFSSFSFFLRARFSRACLLRWSRRLALSASLFCSFSSSGVRAGLAAATAVVARGPGRDRVLPPVVEGTGLGTVETGRGCCCCCFCAATPIGNPVDLAAMGIFCAAAAA